MVRSREPSEGRLEVALEREQLGEAGGLDDPDHAVRGPAQLEAPALGFEALLRLYEEAQAGGIDEPERGQIDDDRIASLLREVAQGRAQ